MKEDNKQWSVCVSGIVSNAVVGTECRRNMVTVRSHESQSSGCKKDERIRKKDEVIACPATAVVCCTFWRRENPDWPQIFEIFCPARTTISQNQMKKSHPRRPWGDHEECFPE